MSNYSDLLKNPKWQKKRLEIMSRDDFACSICGDDKSTLNVHHLFYKKGKKPWEYQDKALITLCDSCHENEHQEKQNLTANFNNLPILSQSKSLLIENIEDLSDIYDPYQIDMILDISMAYFLREKPSFNEMLDKFKPHGVEL
jgi:hypothetical protein